MKISDIDDEFLEVLAFMCCPQNSDIQANCSKECLECWKEFRNKYRN